MNTYERLRAIWLEAGIPVNEAISPGVIEQLEEKRRIRLPDSFKAYLLTVNGMKDGAVDDNLVCFHSLADIDRYDNIKEVSADEVEVVFADYSLNSHLYVLRTTRDGQRCHIFATDGDHEKPLTDSFEEFVASYLSNPAKVAHCWTR